MLIGQETLIRSFVTSFVDNNFWIPFLLQAFSDYVIIPDVQ